MNIPMPLVYVFVAICRRLGIAASATNFPSRVLAHVAPGGGVPDFWVDVFDNGTCPIHQHDEVRLIWSLIVTFQVAFAEDSQPCTPETSLFRQANNIIASIQGAHIVSSNSRAYLAYPAVSVLCLLNTMQWPNGFGIVPDIDLQAILGDLVGPRLHLDNGFHTILETLMEGEASLYSVRKRGELLTGGMVLPKYFVGTVVCSDEFTAACVIGWFVSSPTPLMHSLVILPLNSHQWYPARPISCTNFKSQGKETLAERPVSSSILHTRTSPMRNPNEKFQDTGLNPSSVRLTRKTHSTKFVTPHGLECTSPGQRRTAKG
jgi:hypothetical protein